jgi:oligopeptide/dipeptide ABC transporter ATP-binding protein
MEHIGLLDIHHLSAKYPHGREVLHDISLHLHDGEIICIIGESGSGKTTLLNAILGMPGKVEITQGKIIFAGKDLCTLKGEELRSIRGRGIGMIYQEPGAALNPIRKIGSQFYDTMRAHLKISRKEAERKALELLARLELPEPERVLKSCPVQLSGGMNQRVAIALAMALEPALLLADEPTSALDVTVQAQIVEELLKLRKEYGKTLVVVTHNMGVVAKMADKVSVMYGGRIVEYGYRENILKAPAHPYTRALLAAVPKLDGTPPQAIPGQRPSHFPGVGCAFANRCPYAHQDCTSREMLPISLGGEHWALCDAGFEGSVD